MVWPHARSNKGYGYIRYYGHTIPVHRLSAALAFGPIPAGMIVGHHCDNPPCFDREHLFVGTQSDNMQDARRKGRLRPASGKLNGSHTKPERRPTGERHWTQKHPELRLTGERNPMAKLTQENVDEIRLRYRFRGGLNSGRALAREFKVAESVISRVVRGKSW